MKVLPVLAITLIWQFAVSAEDTLENCSCWSGYKPGIINDKVMCVGTMVLTYKPCNTPQPPKCVCTKYEVTGILTDKDGTFCSNYNNGVEQRRWDCENKEDWDKYKEELAKISS